MTALYDMLAVPFGYILGFFYNISGSYLLAILVITVITRLVLLPSAMRQQKSSAAQMRLQSKIRRIQEMYKGNQQKINEETQALYQREGFNPMSSGCLPLLIQFPVMIGLYSAIRTPLTSVLHLGSDVVTARTDAVQKVAENSTQGRATLQIEVLNHLDELSGIAGVSASDYAAIEKFRDAFQIFGINLAERPEMNHFNVLWLLPIISGVTALLTSIFMMLRQRKQNPSQANNPMMMGCTFLMGPAFSVYFGFQFPGGISVYWIIGNILSFIQTVVLNLIYKPEKLMAQLMIDETVQARAREKSIKEAVKYRD